MRLLLDTHVFLWWIDDHPRLSIRARKMIASADSVFVSSASIWELVIKVGIGKLAMDVDRAVAAISSGGFLELPISVQHATTVASRPSSRPIRPHPRGAMSMWAVSALDGRSAVAQLLPNDRIDLAWPDGVLDAAG